MRVLVISPLPLLAAVLIAIGSFAPAAGQDGAESLPDSITTYLDTALAVMEGNVLGKDTVDWEAFRDSVYRRAAGSEQTVDTYRVLRWALRTLNPHSFLQTSTELTERERARHPPPPDAEAPQERPVYSPFSGRSTPEGRILRRAGATMGYVGVPAFGQRHLTAFADSIEAIIREQHETGACGWVVDLRGNGGGNMWPMLAGLNPLLHDGKVGEFHSSTGRRTEWFVVDGTSGIYDPADGDSVKIAHVSVSGFDLGRRPPVAVLFDGGTGSSGEAVAIAFIGRDNTRSFGVDSYGFTTANNGFRLPDGANLVLTVGVNADRNGVPYPDGVEPDERVVIRADGTIPSEPPAPGEDPQLQAALEWLSDQGACRTGN